MQIETYRKPSAKDITPEELKSSAKELKKKRDCRLNLAQSLRFDSFTQGEMDSEEPPEAAKYYEEISDHDLKIWMWFCGTFYSQRDRQYYFKDYNQRFGGKFENYRFDKIPTRVLEELAFADSLHVFDDLLICTPEEKKNDPIAIGVSIQQGPIDRYFLISRWGESLVPIQTLETRMEQWLKLKTTLDKYDFCQKRDFPAGLGLAMGLAISLLFLILSLSKFLPSLLSIISASVVFGLIFGLVAYGISGTLFDKKCKDIQTAMDKVRRGN